MSWSTRFRIRQGLKGSLWVMPLLAGLLGVAFAWIDVRIDRSLEMPAAWRYSPATASTLLATIVGALVALTGFVLTVSVLVVQMATGTFSARYMRLWYRDRMLKALLAALMGTLTFSFALLRRIESDFVPNLGISVAGLLVWLDLLLFLLFLDRFLHRMRPVAVAALVAELGRRALVDAIAIGDAVGPAASNRPAEDPVLVVNARRAGAIQALDVRGLVRWAAERDGRILVPHAVGDFVPFGATLVEVYGCRVDPAQDSARLHAMIALGIERTIEQDPAFAIRIMVDIADKALSPAVNDPTTAVQVINHLAETLRVLGTADLEPGRELRRSHGPPRLLLQTRGWEDYLALGVTEIRQYGASSIQVVRRLRALLEELLETVRPECRPAVERELGRLAATAAERFGHSIDADLAGVADRQGIGSPAAVP